MGVLPDRFELGANYPNPFNPSTVIPYQLSASTHVRLEVFNLLGQQVASLMDGVKPAGFHTGELGRHRWGRANGGRRGLSLPSQRRRGAGDPVDAADQWTGGDCFGRRRVDWPGETGAGEDMGPAPAYGLTVSGPGLVPYVDRAFRVEGAIGPLDLVVDAPKRVPPAKAAASWGILGDVDNTGGVDFFDAVLVAPPEFSTVVHFNFPQSGPG